MISQRILKQFSTLVYGENRVTKTTLKILNGAKQLNQSVTLLFTSNEPQTLIESIKSQIPQDAVQNVIIAQHPSFNAPQADTLSQLFQQLIDKNNYTNVVTSTSSIAKDFLPRLAVKYLSQPITDVIGIDNEVFKRPIYAGNAIASVKSIDKIKFITLRPTNFEEISDKGNKVSNVEILEVKDLKQIINHVKDEIVKSDKPELNSARFVVSGGRGVGSKENFKILEQLADVLGNTAVGASRAAVDAGYAQNDQQVGQTGKVVAPELYIAVGISGAIQHLAGMKDSKVIVSINKDPEAPIVSVADYNIVGDLFKVVPELTEKLKSIKQ